MIFSSNLFLFSFLPFVLLVYYICPRVFRNSILFIASLCFYFWGSGHIVFVLLLSILANYILSKIIERRKVPSPKIILLIGVLFNLFILIYYKYTNFICEEINAVAVNNGLAGFRIKEIVLPIGISFFTFQAISYLVDTYHKNRPTPHNIINFGMYLSFFPQLIAGPIVRYAEVSKAIISRKENIDMFFQGIYRFSMGLGKKILIADSMGIVVDEIFSLPQNELTAMLSWLGALCYMLQIYFDFSGYSDMAIGLGKFFGFTFPENFDQPYRAQNVTEFWRRWHMTLTRWFRDYLYIPLGGNRKGLLRTYLNLWIVFVLCGFWHGAAWTFFAWGVYHGILLVIERIALNRFGFAPKGIAGTLLTFFFVMIGWVIFRSSTIAASLDYIAAMFGFGADVSVYFDLNSFLTNDKIFFILMGLFFSLFPFEKISTEKIYPAVFYFFKAAASIIIFLYSIIVLSVQGFNPFIYFQF